MHEASLVQGILEIVEKALDDYIHANPGKKHPQVAEIICEAGLLACFEPATLKACFEIFAEGTNCEKAKLVIETASLACHCRGCGHEFLLAERKFQCPVCQSPDITFKGGNGLILKAIKIEDTENG